MQPHEKPIICFVGEQVHARGNVDLLNTFGSGKLSQSLIVLFVLVDVDTLYNVLLSTPTLNKLGAIVSTPHFAM